MNFNRRKTKKKKKLLAVVLMLCMTVCMLSGCGSASGTGKMETKETRVYLFSADPVPVKINLSFKSGSDVPYVSLDDWVEFYTMIMSGIADITDEGYTVRVNYSCTDADREQVTIKLHNEILMMMEGRLPGVVY